MQAKVTKGFKGKPDNEATARDIAVGETVEGELARVAIANKWAEDVKAAAPAKKTTAKKTTAKKG